MSKKKRAKSRLQEFEELSQRAKNAEELKHLYSPLMDIWASCFITDSDLDEDIRVVLYRLKEYIEAEQKEVFEKLSIS